MKKWTIEDAKELYNINGWGTPYFSVNERGNVYVTPEKDKTQQVDLHDVMEELALRPLFDLGMRLGEGSGCPLAFQVLDAACAVMNNMASFDEADINDDYLDEIRQGDQFTP